MNPVCIMSRNENASVAFFGRIQFFPFIHRLIASVEVPLLSVSHASPRAENVWKLFLIAFPPHLLISEHNSW